MTGKMKLLIGFLVLFFIGIERIEPSISQYNWKEKDFPTGPKDGKSFETNNTTITLKVLFLPKQ